ncbi:hypothetical protein PEBR_24208 [Penicillium brasilianum]|uniref:Uncharacterized protein n=1 Tax=Penicillium brasilianum TaxID=104259 RepID=A0A1S9RKT5_PENBI|nr:hypothetical protein PEBR_24208 [Penicillium brasilianum]
MLRLKEKRAAGKKGSGVFGTEEPEESEEPLQTVESWELEVSSKDAEPMKQARLVDFKVPQEKHADGRLNGLTTRGNPLQSNFISTAGKSLLPTAL